jgi:hypothetical protein
MEKTMFRKITLGLLAAASIGATALLPTAASAHPIGWGWGYGYGGGWYPGYVSSPTIVLSTPVVSPMISDPCLQRMPVQTRHGIRYRLVKTCGF